MKKTPITAQGLLLRTALLASVAATPMFTSQAIAQEDSVFEEIVVTARKREVKSVRHTNIPIRIRQ